MLGVVEDGLDEGLKGRVVGFEVVDILLVDAFATVIRIGIVDTFSAVDGGTSSATGAVAIALDHEDAALARCYTRSMMEIGERRHTFDLRLRQAMQAVLTHRLLAAAISLSTSRCLVLLVVEEWSVEL